MTEVHRPRPDGLPLTSAQRAMLEIVLDLIVPPSRDGRLPGASQVGVPAHLLQHAPHILDELAGDLDRLAREARERHGRDFVELDAEVRQALVAGIREAAPGFMNRLALETMTRYYQDDRVLAAIDEPVRAPYPQGYQVIQGDLGLLAPVRKRGKLYRDAP